MTTLAPGPIMGHLDAIRSAHRKVYGLELSWPEAVRRLDAFNALQDDPTMPPQVWEVQVGCWLISEGYTPEAIRRVLTHCAIYGSAGHSEDLDADDAEAVDAILPVRTCRAISR
jgi:hypothetical protein